jgi:flagellar biogenesis protein FliO
MMSTLRRICATALTLGVMALSVPAMAEPVDAGAPSWLAQNPPVESAPASTLPVGRMLMLLAVTAGLAGGAWYLRKRKLGVTAATGQRRLQVLDSARIGPKAQLVVVSVNGKTMLLGVTETNIRRLAWTEVEAPAALQSTEGQNAEDQKSQGHDSEGQSDTFNGMLRSLMNSEADRQRDATEPEPERQRPAIDSISRSPLRSIDSLKRTMELARAEVPDSVEGQALGLTSRRGRRRT